MLGELRRFVPGIRRRRSPFGKTTSRALGVQPTADELEALEMVLRLARGERTNAPHRRPTDEEVVEAAWGNLNVEEPDLKIEDVRGVLSRVA